MLTVCVSALYQRCLKKNLFQTPIYSAVCMGKQKLVAAMIQRGADVNLQCCFETQVRHLDTSFAFVFSFAPLCVCVCECE